MQTHIPAKVQIAGLVPPLCPLHHSPHHVQVMLRHNLNGRVTLARVIFGSKLVMHGY